MDKISMNGMAFYGYHGVFPEENMLGQRYIVDAELVFSIRAAGGSDDLDQTVNYAEAYGHVKEIVEGPPFKLIEALAEHLASALLNRYSILEEVTVRVTKPNPPFDIHFAGVTVDIRRKRPVQACIGLGSNIGDRLDYLERAIRLLDEHRQIRVLRKSAIYETDPVGYEDQPAFLNMAIAVETDLGPDELLGFMLQTEQVLGRVRDVRWGPRTVDLDLLLYGKEIRANPLLAVPHPRLGERAFVLIPLAEIVADDAVPGIPSLAARLAQMKGKEGVRLWT